MEGRRRRQALRAERTRSLSPEKKASISQPASASPITGPKTPYLSSNTNLTSKEEEIKRTIAAIAGPSGSLPLFPQPKSSTPKSSEPTLSDTPAKEENIVPEQTKPIQPKDTLPKEENKNKEDEPVYSLPKRNLIKPTKPEVVVKEKEPLYSLPKKSTPIPAPKEKAEEAPIYSLPKKSIPPPKAVPKSVEDEEPIYALPKRASTFPKKEQEQVTTVPPSKKLNAPPIVAPKPRNLSSSHKPLLESDQSESQQPKRETESPKGLKNTVDPTSQHQPATPTIISNRPSSAGLRKFQNTKEHNNHNQVSNSINGMVPLPGMSKSNSFAVGSTLSNKVTSPRGSFLSTRPQPKFSPNTVDLTPKAPSSPAGSFLATRSPSPVSRSKSPVRGGFVQSAMLKREGTLSLRSRAGSTDSPPPSLADSPIISLVNPVARVSSRSPSPSRAYSHTQSNSISSLTGNYATISGYPKKNESGDESPPRARLEKQSRGGNFPTPERNDSTRSLNSSNSVEDLRVVKPASENNEEVTLESSPTRESVTPKSDARRWSPVRSTWLESALKKSPSTSGVDRAGTVRANPSIPLPRTGSAFARPTPPKPPAKYTRPPSGVKPSEPSVDDSTEKNLEGNKVEQPESLNEETAVENKKEQPAIERTLSTKKPVPPPPRAASTLARAPSAKPTPPKKPDGTKVPSEALERLRQLRAGTLNNSNSERDAANLARLKATVSRYKASRENQDDGDKEEDRPPLPTRPGETAPALAPPSRGSPARTPIQEKDDSDDETNRPPLPKRPSESTDLPVKPTPRALPKAPEFAKETPRALPKAPESAKENLNEDLPIKRHVPEHHPPPPPVRRGGGAPSTTFRVAFPPSLIPHTRSLEPELPPEPVTMKYQPAPDTDTTLDNAAIPSAITKKTAKSFASNLSEVLQRGKGLSPLEDTTTSFSPRFERMTDFAGPKKAKTFDDSILLPSSSSKESQKKELTHITKTRAKGPKRRLPKAATAPAAPANTISDTSERGRTHMRQRSRSLSPFPKESAPRRESIRAYQSESTTPQRSSSPPPPFPRRSGKIENAAEIFAPSNSFKPKPVIRGGLNVPKTRINAIPAASEVPRPKPVISKPSRVVSDKMKVSAAPSPASPTRKPLPVPPKPRKLSASVTAE